MPLSAGTRLGPYEIVAPLGAGGMGEVFRATDTRLGREVAIKVLPQHLSANPEVRARFEREAKTVSSLNHPHICTLHDVGREGDTDYLVMELVDGETLYQRLAKGALPAAEVLRLGGQIADALDRAHRAGVVHRDLKPGNVMLTRSGAKLMDFGIARATGMAGPASGSGVTMAALTQSPTMAAPLTAEGSIVGTFQYMSPEQLEGKEADARSDLWALGCVLYEMATGQRAFEGKSQASLISSIMTAQPAPIAQLAPLAPPGLERLVQACLAKDPAERLQSAHDIRMQLAWLAEGGSQAGGPAPVAARRKGRERLAWAVAAVAAAIAAAAVGWSVLRPGGHGAEQPFFASIAPAADEVRAQVNAGAITLSPDGSRLAKLVVRAGEQLISVYDFTTGNSNVLESTKGAEYPFWSPDGRWIGFFVDGKLAKVEATGGPSQVLADAFAGRSLRIHYPEGGVGPATEAAVYGGPTRNPWNLSRTPGGSSGGAGAAVAAGIVPAAHGSDGGGSVRIPASCCGLFGLKPTRARLPDGPYAGEGWAGMAIDGFLTRSVRDSAVLLDACAGADPGAPYWAPPLGEGYRAALARPPRRMRIAICDTTLTGEPIHADCRKAVLAAAKLLESLGHHVEPARPAADTRGMMEAWTKVVGCGTALSIRKALAAKGRELRPDDVEDVGRSAVTYAATLSGADYLDAVGKIHAYGREMAAFFEGWDMLLTATLAEPPAEIGRFGHRGRDYVDYRMGPGMVFDYSPFCAAFNASGQPAVSLPLHMTAEGLPVGVHLAARFGADEELIALSAEVEAAAPWAGRRAPLPAA